MGCRIVVKDCCNSIMPFIHYSLRLFLGWKVTEQQLEEVAQLSDVFCDELDDYLLPDFRTKCEELGPDPLKLDANEYADVFCYLKDNIDISN